MNPTKNFKRNVLPSDVIQTKDLDTSRTGAQKKSVVKKI